MKGQLTRASTIIAAALLIAGGAVAPAGAAGTGCTDLFGDLRTATNSSSEFPVVEYKSRNAVKDEQGLLTKVDAAEDKYDHNKDADSIRKLADYKSKVKDLLDQGKLVELDPSIHLIELADDVIACVEGA